MTTSCLEHGGQVRYNRKKGPQNENKNGLSSFQEQFKCMPRVHLQASLFCFNQCTNTPPQQLQKGLSGARKAALNLSGPDRGASRLLVSKGAVLLFWTKFKSVLTRAWINRLLAYLIAVGCRRCATLKRLQQDGNFSSAFGQPKNRGIWKGLIPLSTWAFLPTIIVFFA